jgi:hypothetical protein
MGDPTFEERQRQLLKQWEGQESEDETDEELAASLLQVILESERLRHGVSAAGRDREQVDKATIERLSNPDTLGPEFSLAEAAFRRLAKSPVDAVRYLDQAKAQERAAQSARARKPRPTRYDSITVFINNAVRANRKISWKALLKQFVDSPEFDVAGDDIRSFDDAATLKVSNLPNRLTSARRRFSA